MSRLAILLAGASLAALDVSPEPGLDASGWFSDPKPGMSLGNEWFHDVRLALGVAAPAQDAEVNGLRITAETGYGGHAAAQYVAGCAGRSFGWALGLEAAYDDHIGEVVRVNQSVPGYQGVNLRMETYSLHLLPKLVVRPFDADVIDWAPGSVQIEIGPFAGIGFGRGYAGGGKQTTPAMVWSWGVRSDLILTSVRDWQFGVSLALEYFGASPDWDGVDGSLSGHGPAAALVIGRRL